MYAGVGKDEMMKVFPASLDKLYEMLLFVKGYAEEVGVEQRIITNIELAAEEALVNIISYGYPKVEGDIEILCSPSEKRGLKIIIQDKGIPYNPLVNKKEVPKSLPVEERGVGGYGIYFILKIMDKVEYKRDNGRNVLTLIKYGEK